MIKQRGVSRKRHMSGGSHIHRWLLEEVIHPLGFVCHSAFCASVDVRTDKGCKKTIIPS
jgi:hypothetical protein